MKEIIESYFQTRSLVNHQLASYDDCIPTADSQSSRFEGIVRNIRIGTDETIEDDEGNIEPEAGNKAVGNLNMSPEDAEAVRDKPVLVLDTTDVNNGSYAEDNEGNVEVKPENKSREIISINSLSPPPSQDKKKGL